MAELTFDPDTHIYRLDGRIVPSVTQILSEAGLVDDRWYTEDSQLRGRTVHIITALDDRGELNESQVADGYRGYLAAWRCFKADTMCTIEHIERRVHNTAFHYAGTIDRLIRCNGFGQLIDIKTGQPGSWHPIQTAAYWNCDDMTAAIRSAVYLRTDGSWKHIAHDDTQDVDIFRAALAIANWKRNKGITNGRDRSN